MHANAGCTDSLPLKDFRHHLSVCSFREREKVVKKTRNVSVRKPLKEVEQDYAKSRRLSSVLQHINTFCQRRKEDRGDLLFFVLREHLRENCDPRYKEVDKIWEGHPGQMTVEDCLAFRVSNLQRESNYRNQYDFLEFKQHHVFQAPNYVYWAWGKLYARKC